MQQLQKQKKQNRSYGLFVRIVLLAVGISVCICCGKNILYYQQLQKEQALVLAEIEAEKEKQAGFENRREYYHSDAYIEQIAREQLGMIKPNEILYVNRSE